MKKIISFSLLIASFLILIPASFAQKIPTLEMFHGRECPHCHKQMEWLPELKEMYPDVEIKKYEVWHDTENQALFSARMAELGKKAEGVPTNIIEGDVSVGFNPVQILQLMEKHYGAPTGKTVAAEAVAIEPDLEKAVAKRVAPSEDLVAESEAKPVQKTLWQKIVDFFANLFN